MNARQLSLWAVGIGLGLTLLGCGTTASTGDPASSDADPGTGSTADRPVDSVGDVTQPDGSDATDGGAAVAGGASARVRNESDASAEVTLRFLQDELVVHLAYVRVEPGMETTVTSRAVADSVRVSGVTADGSALTSAVLIAGEDYGVDEEAVYTITPAEDPGQSLPPGDDEPVDEPDDDDEPAAYEPPTITLLEPDLDLEVALGSTFTVSWEDTTAVAGTVVWIGLRAVDGDDTFQPVGPAVGADLDGLNDQLLVLAQGLDEGVYEVVARIDDGETVVTAAAAGLVEVISDVANTAPAVELLGPTELQQLNQGELLTVTWRDTDPDDNATLVFSLVPTDPDEALGGTFVISPPLAEDPDSDPQDELDLSTAGVLPGLYDLLATISDAELQGTARLVGAVEILPEPDNDPPTLRLTEPGDDVELAPEASFLARWEDTDANDNARVSLLLDPDLSGDELDGNEVLLVASLGEDDDDEADEVRLGLPPSLTEGTFRLVGVITDGQVTVLAAAPGLLVINGDSGSRGGGGGGGDPDPPPGDGDVVEDGDEDPPPDPALLRMIVHVQEPSGSLTVAVGETIPFVSSTMKDIPGTLDVRFLLVDPNDNWNVAVDITPVGFDPANYSAYPLVLTQEVREYVEPGSLRAFKLNVELMANGSVIGEAEAPATIWVSASSGPTGAEPGGPSGVGDDPIGIPEP